MISRVTDGRSQLATLGYRVIGSPTDSGSVSLGSSPSIPANTILLEKAKNLQKIAYLIHFLEESQAAEASLLVPAPHMTFLNRVILPKGFSLTDWESNITAVVAETAPFTMNPQAVHDFGTPGNPIPVLEYTNPHGSHLELHNHLVQALPEDFLLGRPEISGERFRAHISHFTEGSTVTVDSLSLSIMNEDYSDKEHIKTFHFNSISKD